MASNGAFDLASFDGLVEAQEAGIEVEINGPDGKPLGENGFRIRIAGVDSKRFRSIRREFLTEDLAGESFTELTPDQQDDRQLRTLARCTLAWSPVILDGGDFLYSEANARALYRRFPFIRDQVELKAGRRQSFMPRSAVASAELSEINVTENASDSPQ